MSSQTIFLLILILLGAAFYYFKNSGSIDPSKAKELVREGALLVDVRTPGEYSSGNIQGSKNIPINELDNRIGELGDKDRVIIYSIPKAGQYFTIPSG